MPRSRHLTLAMAAFVAVIFVFAAPVSANAKAEKRSGAGPCRQGALAIIAFLSNKEDDTADYRRVYKAIVETCGPVARASTPAPSASSREDCEKAALAVLDAIEDNKINTKGFVQLRGRFAQSCAPR